MNILVENKGLDIYIIFEPHP